MESDSWLAFYRSDLQSVYLLLLIPAGFAVYWWRAARKPIPRDPLLRFVRVYCAIFCIETLLDPLATGPLVRVLGFGGTALGLCFVLLGDFRVFLLVLRACEPERALRAVIAEAALWTPVVAVSAYAIRAGLDLWIGDTPGQLLWMIHELLFVGIAGFFRSRIVPSRTAVGDPVRNHLRRVLGYVIAYYALWALSDALILFGGFDAGWLLRVVPNQLYYSIWIPFVYATFFDGFNAPGRASDPSSH